MDGEQLAGGPPVQTDAASDRRVVVTVYSTGPQCVQCTATIRRLDAAGIAYRLVDLSDEGRAADRQYVTEELGYTRAPVVVVEDEPQNHWSGFDPVQIDRLAARAVRI